MKRSIRQGTKAAVNLLTGQTKTRFSILLLIGAITFSAVAQEPSKQQRPRQVHPRRESPQVDDTLRIDTDLVSVDVNVSDSEGRTVRNLQEKDFKLFADGIEQPLAF